MALTRQVVVDMKYDNKDITKDVTPFLLSVRYVDRTKNSQCDVVDVTFQDVDGLWRGGWYPERGAKFAVKFKVYGWFNADDYFERDAGGFEIDDLTSVGPPSTFSIGAVSIGITNSIRRQQNTKAWENINVKQIAQEVADKHGFELKWYSNYNPKLERWEQRGQSDSLLLVDLCEYVGLTLKFTDKWIVIYNGKEFDAKKPEVTIYCHNGGVKGYTFNANSADIYMACEVKYFHPEKKELIEYIFYSDDVKGPKIDTENGDIPEPEVGKVLKLNQRVNDVGEAESLARAVLRSRNMRQVTATIDSIGRPDLYSGMTLRLSGFGRWDTVIWSVEEIVHEYSKGGGYNSTISLRGVLGY